jgi:hypothetical protein
MLLLSAEISLMLLMDVMEVLFNALAAVGEDLQQFFTGAIEPLKKIITDLIEGFVEPMQIILIAILNTLLRFKLV